MKTLSELESLLKEIYKQVCAIEAAEYTKLGVNQASVNGALGKVEFALRNAIDDVNILGGK